MGEASHLACFGAMLLAPFSPFWCLQFQRKDSKDMQGWVHVASSHAAINCDNGFRMSSQKAMQVKARQSFLRSVPLLCVIPGRQKPNCSLPTPPFDNLVATPRFFHLPALTPSPHWNGWSATKQSHCKSTQSNPTISAAWFRVQTCLDAHLRGPNRLTTFEDFRFLGLKAFPTFTSMYLLSSRPTIPVRPWQPPLRHLRRSVQTLHCCFLVTRINLKQSQNSLIGTETFLHSPSQRQQHPQPEQNSQKELQYSPNTVFLRERTYDRCIVW